MERLTIEHLKGVEELKDFCCGVPNAETKAAMKEAREGNLKTYSSVDEMMKDILG